MIVKLLFIFVLSKAKVLNIEITKNAGLIILSSAFFIQFALLTNLYIPKIGISVEQVKRCFCHNIANIVSAGNLCIVIEHILHDTCSS